MPIYSMTGFARVQVRVPLREQDQLSYTLTVKSVNHRFLDVQLRLPAGLGCAGDGTAQGAEGQPGARPRGSYALRRSVCAARPPATIANWWLAILPHLPRRERNMA